MKHFKIMLDSIFDFIKTFITLDFKPKWLKILILVLSFFIIILSCVSCSPNFVLQKGNTGSSLSTGTRVDSTNVNVNVQPLK